MRYHHRLLRRLSLATLAFVIALALAQHQLARWDEQDLEQAEQHLMEQIRSHEFAPMQQKVEAVFRALYSQVRTITLMPGVQKIRDPDKTPAQNELVASKRFLAESGGTIQQIFNILSSDVSIVKVFASIEGLDYWNSLVPFFAYSRVNNSIQLNTVAAPEIGDGEDSHAKVINAGEFEYQYEYFPDQIDKLKTRHPVFHFASLDDIPAISMHLQQACERTALKTECATPDRAALLYSIPFYNQKSRAMTGMVSAIVRFNALEAVLLKVTHVGYSASQHQAANPAGFNPPKEVAPFALVNQFNDIVIADRRNPAIVNAVKSGAPNGGRLLNQELSIHDENTWHLYYFLSADKLDAALTEVHSANTRRHWEVRGYLALLYLLSLSYLRRSLITRCELSDLKEIERTIVSVSKDFDLGQTAKGLVTKKAQETSAALSFLFTSLADMISSLREAERKLHIQATRDSLTGLPNRALLLDRMNQAIARQKRHAAKLAVLFIDLNKFKFINDSLGHAAGDLVLKEMARRLLALSRGEDTVARLGGDEFVLTYELSNSDVVEQLGQRVVTALCQPMQLFGTFYTLGGSVGIALYPEHGDSAEALLKHADIAMYQAKKNNENFLRVFDEDMQHLINERLQMEARLRRGIAAGELLLHYQPQVDFKTGTLVGLEALVRWNSPDYGFLGPGRFIPLAEESSLIDSIDNYVLDAACAQIKTWHDNGQGWVRVAVNLAATKFAKAGFEQELKDCLARHQVPSCYLELEVTESLAMKDPDQALSLMRQLKTMGVLLSIDDFGTGYSNLGYLKRFPAERLKIDQSFIRSLLKNAQDRALVVTIIELAHSLSMRTMAEGVETEEEAVALYAMGADEVQGYWISRPQAPQDILAMLNAKSLLSAASLLDASRLTPVQSPPLVLIVEDEPITQTMIEALLQDCGVTTLCANSSEAAIALLGAAPTLTMALVDHGLPGENGIFFLAHLRAHLPHAIRVMLTANSDPHVLRDAINIAGVSQFLNKPIDPDALRACVIGACWPKRG